MDGKPDSLISSSAGISGVIKSYFLAESTRSTDVTFSSAGLLIWSGAETGISIMAASLPSLHPILQNISQSSRTTTETENRQKMSWGFHKRSKKYGTLDDDWINGASNPDGGPRRGQLVMQDGKAMVTYL